LEFELPASSVRVTVSLYLPSPPRSFVLNVCWQGKTVAVHDDCSLATVQLA
jgi:hypothetical protein